MKRILLSLVLFGAHSVVLADVKLPAFFADHMVFQREMLVPIWGTADAGEKVTVAFAGQQKTAAADPSGKWRVTLDKLPASAEPRELTVSGSNARKISDVLVGEVWLASGQSNMGFPLSSAHDATEAIASATDAQLRFFTVKNATAAEPQGDLHGTWEASDPNTAKGFSAVAYFFARELRAKLECPVAILHSSWGGTPAQAWLSMDALRLAPPSGMEVLRTLATVAPYHLPPFLVAMASAFRRRAVSLALRSARSPVRMRSRTGPSTGQRTSTLASVTVGWGWQVKPKGSAPKKTPVPVALRRARWLE